MKRALAISLVVLAVLALARPSVGANAQDETPAGTPPTATPQEAVTTGLVVQEPGVLPPAASEQARATWKAMLAAIGALPATPDEPTGAPAASTRLTNRFDMRLGLLTRSGRRGDDPRPESHEFDTRIIYMAPFFVRYQLPQGVETGFGPDGFWLRDKDEIVMLRGRDYKTDQEQVQQVLSLCQNFLSIATPGRLRLAVLEQLDRMPFTRDELPQRPGFDYDRLLWLRTVTPDFLLVEAIQPKIEGQEDDRPQALYQVYFGLDRKTFLPRALHVVRVGARPRDMIFEQLILLENWGSAGADGNGSDGLPHPRVLIPQRIYVHERLPGHSQYGPFLLQPDREVYVRQGSTLFPNLTDADFDPKQG
ncbi:hypothetical protein Pla163_24690 [Planctomycetes bacterium Pla163]|uniref:Uncharacterized protein n=1 Tax=Rohdeia mirabilis TaxID=2528008 RepID=A0A518D1I3_9BACT|nr:hypothetical protein Pla163_24690 [Planctomycetes bacterium Pla163]